MRAWKGKVRNEICKFGFERKLSEAFWRSESNLCPGVRNQSENTLGSTSRVEKVVEQSETSEGPPRDAAFTSQSFIKRREMDGERNREREREQREQWRVRERKTERATER